MKEFVDAGFTSYVPQVEIASAVKSCGIEEEVAERLVIPYGDGFNLKVGRIKLKFLHTPGHSSGSSVVVASDAAGKDRVVVTGDTLFPGSCGRIDLPDSNKMDMYRSLQTVVAKLPDHLVVYPGHGYGGKSSTIGQEKMKGLLRPTTEAQWKRQHGL